MKQFLLRLLGVKPGSIIITPVGWPMTSEDAKKRGYLDALNGARMNKNLIQDYYQGLGEGLWKVMNEGYERPPMNNGTQ